MSLCEGCRRLLGPLFTLCWRSTVDEHEKFIQKVECIGMNDDGPENQWYSNVHVESSDKELVDGLRTFEGLTQEISFTSFHTSCTVSRLEVLQNCEDCWACSKMCTLVETDLTQCYEASCSPGVRINSPLEGDAHDITFHAIQASDLGSENLYLIIGAKTFQNLEFFFCRDGNYIDWTKRTSEMSNGSVRIIEHPMPTTEISHGLEIAHICETEMASRWEVDWTSTADSELDPDRMIGERIKMVHGWLGECRENHPKCRSSLTIKQAQRADLPKRLINVSSDGGRIWLIETDQMLEFDLSYVTLSHCWGQEKFLNLTEENYDALLKGISTVELAITFQHTCHLTRRLGFHYLWIDCLCIIQNSEGEEDWKEEAVRMHIIYGNSALTIAATGSTSADSGLFRPLNMGLSTRGVIKLPNGLLLCSSDKEAVDFARREFERSPLLKRGWVQQEMALSRRILHWTKGQLVWQCNTVVKAETLGPVVFNKHNELWPGMYGDAALLASQRAVSATLVAQRWTAIARSYAPTAVTRPHDRYSAISSLAIQTQYAFERAGVHTAYIAGAWKHDITRWMAWHRDLCRLELDQSTSSFISLEAAPFIPSWSWLRSTDRVYFPGLREYAPEFVRIADGSAHTSEDSFAASGDDEPMRDRDDESSTNYGLERLEGSGDESVGNSDEKFVEDDDDGWIPYAEVLDSHVVLKYESQPTGPLTSAVLTMKALRFEDIEGLDVDFEEMTQFKKREKANGNKVVCGFKCFNYRAAPDQQYRSMWGCQWHFDIDAGEIPQTRKHLEYIVLGKTQWEGGWCVYALIIQRTHGPLLHYKRIGIFLFRLYKLEAWESDPGNRTIQECFAPSIRPQIFEEEIIRLV